MRQRIVLLTCFIISFLAACKKQDYCSRPPEAKTACDLMQSFVTLEWDNGLQTFSQYRKVYDANGRIAKVVATFFTLTLVDSIKMILKYDGNTIYFLDEIKQSDTVFIATFNSQKRIQEIAVGKIFDENEDFSTTKFNYANKRLSDYTIYDPFEEVGSTKRLTYDSVGNIVRIYWVGSYDFEGIFYTYDLSVKAKGQFYSDDFIEGSQNTFYLAEFMGWLPDLMPVNKRLTSKIVEGSTDPEDPGNPDDVNVYVDNHLTDHVYDENSNLLSYKIYSTTTYTNVWNCAVKKGGSPN